MHAKGRITVHLKTPETDREGQVPESQTGQQTRRGCCLIWQSLQSVCKSQRYLAVVLQLQDSDIVGNNQHVTGTWFKYVPASAMI